MTDDAFEDHDEADECDLGDDYGNAGGDGDVTMAKNGAKFGGETIPPLFACL